jgi:hypothetical protein
MTHLSATLIRRVLLLAGCCLAAVFSLALPTASTASAADCQEFVADVTVPDGVPVWPGQVLDKVWRVRNCGDTTWDGYRAVRTQGDYGPPWFDVPTTAPGATADILVGVQAPTSPGCQRVTYQLEGPSGRFGSGFYVEVLVTEPDGSAPAPMLRLEDLEAVLVPPSDLGANWSLVFIERHEGSGCRDGPAYVAFYQNAVDYPARAPARYLRGRTATFGVQSMGDSSLVDTRLAEPGLPRDPVREPAEGLGDGPAFRQWSSPSEEIPIGAVIYSFRVGIAMVTVSVSEEHVPGAELDAQARRFALMQADRVRTALEAASARAPVVSLTAPPSTPAVPPPVQITRRRPEP